MFLKILQISQQNICVGVFKQSCLLKETPLQLFSYEICEICRNIIFGKTPPEATSGYHEDAALQEQYLYSLFL